VNSARRSWWLGLGSNVGDREAILRRAIELLAAADGVSVIRTSGLYETAPWGDTNQGSFLNLAAEVSSSLEPRELLATAKRIERELGRRPRRRWGPREIDIDLLLAEGLEYDAPDLTVPHPALLLRPFVLIPLAEVAPDVLLPDGRRAAEAAIPDESVRLLRKLP
jgi:2-amino-4-hydroxy-6-hydroxymethyldihydropteridine diphosphokinase